MAKKKTGPQGDPHLDGPVVDSEYDELDRQGKLRRVLQLRKERIKLIAEWQNVWTQLHKCGAQTWTDRFAMRMLREGKSVHKNLQNHFDVLYRRQSTLVVRIRKIFQGIVDLGGTVKTPMELPIFEDSEMSSVPYKPSEGRNANTAAQWRDQLIRRHRNLSNEELCRRLDIELGLTVPPLGFPGHWLAKYGVETYLGAYENPKSKNLVQKLISKAKQDL